jgi:Holliday junction resolvasome RuvABC endonuclease subunit
VIVAGVDPSLTSAGVAVLKDGWPVHVSHHGLNGHDGASWTSRSRRVRWTCGQIITALATCTDGIDLVMIEGPSYGSKFGSAFDRAGLWHGLYAALDARKVPVGVVAPQTRAKWAAGTARAEKREVLDAVRTWYPEQSIANDDEADALVLATIGAFHLGEPMPFEVKPRHTTGLEKVAWP